jgi:hypothetical protein
VLPGGVGVVVAAAAGLTVIASVLAAFATGKG